MADEKDKKVEPVDHNHMSTVGSVASVAITTKVEPEPTEEELEQAVIKAEMEAGILILNANKRLEATREKLRQFKTDSAIEIGYGEKTWAGSVFLQCLYCPLDTPLSDKQRMLDHIEASHPEPRGLPTYDNLGNSIEGK